MKTWFITGCSTGLGRSLARAVLRKGDAAVVTARKPEILHGFEQEFPENALVLPLDVTDTAAIQQAVQTAEGHFGGIDVLINNAGYGYRAAVEEGDSADTERLFRTDFAGRSLTQSGTEIADYEATAGARRIGKDTSHGTQPGDPDKGADLIIRAATAEEPPFRLLLGSDAVRFAETVMKSRRAEYAAWQCFSLKSDF